MRSISRLSWLAVVLLGSCTSPQPFRPFPGSLALDPGGGRLDVIWVEDFAFVDVRIDGKPAGRFLLDTGASVVLVTPQLVDALGLPRRTIGGEGGGFVLPGANASSTTIERVVAIAELRCGPLRVRDLDAMELDTGPLQRVLGSRVDGVLPATAFGEALLTIDYPARQVTVGPCPPPGGATEHTLPLLPGALPQVTVRLGESDVPILLDSGSSEFLTVPASVPMPRRGQPAETGRQQTIGGAIPTYQVRADADVDWAGHALAAPVVELGREARGAAGARLLRHFRVELDQRNRLVRFLRPVPGPLACPPVRGMGLGFLRDTTHWTVAYVLAGTPAAGAALQVGDHVLAVDGIDVGTLTREHYEQLLARRDSLRLRVRAGDGGREVHVPVAVLVP